MGATEISDAILAQVTFTATVGSNTAVKTTSIGTCYDYDIAIDRANVITVTGIDRNE